MKGTKMLKLSDREWVIARISDVFSIKSTSSGIDKGKLDGLTGIYPYITRSAARNGIQNFIAEQKGESVDDGNVITIGLDTQTAFYQPFPFFTGQNIQILKNSELDSVNAKFVLPLLRNAMSALSWGGNGATLTRLRRAKMLLPVNSKSEIDWEFMHGYIVEREASLLNGYIKHAGEQDLGRKIIPLNEKMWSGFYIEDFAEIVSGRDIYKQERTLGNTPYISSTSLNNGIAHFVSNINHTKEVDCISVNRNGSVGYAFYHPYSALYSNDCRKLRLHDYAQNSALFIAAQITAQKDKYNYAYKMGTARLKRQKVLLPVDELGKPDWDYMEEYSRQKMKQLTSIYLCYLQSKKRSF